MNITFINDEVGDSLDTAIQFALDNNLKSIEMRSVNGKNLLNLSLSEIADIAQKIHSQGLKVICFASPLLKWLPPDKKSITDQVNWHGYTPEGNDQEVFAKTFAIADLLCAKYIRVFSYLQYDGFQFEDLLQDFTYLLDLAEKHDKILVLENEPVCNILTLEDFWLFLSKWNHPRLRGLLDLGNLYQAGIKVVDEEIKRLSPYLGYVHLKDFSLTQGCYVTLGTGSVFYQQHLLALNPNSLYFSLETHVKANKLEATQLSMIYLKRLLEKINTC